MAGVTVEARAAELQEASGLELSVESTSWDMSCAMLSDIACAAVGTYRQQC